MTTDQEIMQHFLPGSRILESLGLFESNIDGGVFAYYRAVLVDGRRQSVCLLRATYDITNPLDDGSAFAAIDGVESGYGLAAVGCYLLDDEGLVRREDSRAHGHGLEHAIFTDDSGKYALYLLMDL